jgi:hypothetical protein
MKALPVLETLRSTNQETAWIPEDLQPYDNGRHSPTSGIVFLQRMFSVLHFSQKKKNCKRALLFILLVCQFHLFLWADAFVKAFSSLVPSECNDYYLNVFLCFLRVLLLLFNWAAVMMILLCFIFRSCSRQWEIYELRHKHCHYIFHTVYLNWWSFVKFGILNTLNTWKY